MHIFQSWMGRNELARYNELFRDEPLNILISYAHARGVINTIYSLKEQGKINLLMMDSGTYTVRTKGIAKYPHVTFEGYLSHMTDHHDRFDFVINFDEIHAPEGFEVNYSNQLALEDAGIPVIPVIQDIVGEEEIRTYRQDGSEMMALGSQQVKKPENLDIAFQKLSGTQTKVHLLGKTEYKFLIQQPLFSADSSSAIQNVKKGVVLFWNDNRDADDNGDQTDLINLGDPRDKNGNKVPGTQIDEYEYQQDFEQYLADFDMTLSGLCKTERDLVKKIINMRYFKILESKVTDYHREKGWLDTNNEILTIR